LIFSRKSCGTDFISAVLDGRIKVSFGDYHNIYESIGVFGKNAGAQTSIGFSYRLTQTIEEDMPYVYKRKEDRIIKNMKKDIVSVFISGIDKVDWKNGKMKECLEKGAIGVLPDGEYPETVTACVTMDKNFQ